MLAELVILLGKPVTAVTVTRCPGGETYLPCGFENILVFHGVSASEFQQHLLCTLLISPYLGKSEGFKS